MRNRVVYPDWRTWLDASLFPFKIYTVLAVVIVMAWRAAASGNKWALADSYTFGHFVAIGYFLIAAILLAGGIFQGVIHLWRAGTWSMSFASVALVIGICMAHYFNAGGCFGVPVPVIERAW